MRVAQIFPFPNVGGTEVGQIRVMRAARKAGYESFALCFDSSPQILDFVRGQGFEAEAWVPAEPSLRGLVGFLKESSRLAAHLKASGVRLVHCADIRGAYYGAVAGRLAGVPVLSHVRNRYRELPRLERFWINRANHFAFVSRSTWDQFCLPVAPSKGQVLYDGVPVPETPVDLEAIRRSVREEFHLSPSTALVGMFARIAPQKDYETLARAAAQIHPDVRFLLVGEHEASSHTPQVRQWIAGMEDRFLFAGHRTDVPRLMQAIDVFVLSTHWEGLPLVILEAMGMGCPVISTDVDGVSELVTHGETGLLVPHADSDALATALGCLLEDKEKASRFGQAGREVVRNRFSVARFEADLATLYKRIIQSAG